MRYLAAVLVLTGAAHAYVCPPPAARTYASKDKAYQLDVSAENDAVFTHAGEKVWQKKLPEQVVSAYVSDGGHAVILYKYALATVAPSGDPVADLKLTDFLTKKEIKQAGDKCGSWWWVSAKLTFEGGTFVMRLKKGRTLQLDLATGKVAAVKKRTR